MSLRWPTVLVAAALILGPGAPAVAATDSGAADASSDEQTETAVSLDDPGLLGDDSPADDTMPVTAAASDLHGSVAYLPVTPRSSEETSPGSGVEQLGVQVGSLFIASGATSQAPVVGYQVVVLSAQWQPTAGAEAVLLGGAGGDGVLSNTTYVGSTLAEQQTMFQDIQSADYSACAEYGCYLVIASLNSGMGYVGCADNQPFPDVCDLSTAMPGGGFAALGGSTHASYADPGASYSLVAAIGRNAAQGARGSPAAGTGSRRCRASSHLSATPPTAPTDHSVRPMDRPTAP